MTIREYIVVSLFSLGFIYKFYKIFFRKIKTKYDYLLMIVFLVGVLNILLK